MTTQVEVIVLAERESVRLKGIQLKGLFALSELEVGPEATAVGLGRKLEARLRGEELGIAERMDPHWVLLGMHSSQEGTTRSRGTASQPVDAAVAAAEVSDQYFESSAVSIAVASVVGRSYDR